MIITRSPLRITLGGGGTDLPSYYERHTGFLIAAAIDKYVYTTIHRTFAPELILKYSRMERAQSPDEVQHPIIREALKLTGVDTGVEICSMADIPAGTGLGSSGSFTTALLKGLHTLRKHLIQPEELAAEACRIELDILREPIGKQDQYIASLGGLTCFRFHPDGRVEAWPLKISEQTRFNLEDNLVLFFTGRSRQASTVLRDQDTRCRTGDTAITENLHFTKDLGERSREALEQGDLREFARLMHTHWEHKKQRCGAMTSGEIDEWYQLAMRSGALGGKLIGAGGGGFLMFYAEDKTRLRHAMGEAGLAEVRFRFDFEGTRVLCQ